MIKLRGVAASGIGDLAAWTTRYAAEYSAAVGTPLESLAWGGQIRTHPLLHSSADFS